MTRSRIRIRFEQISGNPRTDMDWIVRDEDLEAQLKLMVERWRQRYPAAEPNPTQATLLD
mgnify:CR=1 FL=1